MNTEQKKMEASNMVNEVEVKITENESGDPIILKYNYFGSLRCLTLKREENNHCFNVESGSKEIGI